MHLLESMILTGKFFTPGFVPVPTGFTGNSEQKSYSRGIHNDLRAKTLSTGCQKDILDALIFVLFSSSSRFFSVSDL